ncbi:MAG TPA: IS1595 family transposase [Allosphingosinicella sp.]|jgi:transposase-like protein|nr:IS1595 family transposase [Allosphingosinicella sp.]
MEKKSPSASPAFSVREFFARFPTEEACLDHIMAVRFGGTRFDCPACGVENATFHRLAQRRAYSCAHCAHHVYPTAGTILQDTRTPLVSWFYAIYLFTTTRHGVSGKELQRQLGVTYKTAWRMGQQIRQLTGAADFAAMLCGHVEADEAYIGGVRPGKRGRGAAGKTIAFGMVERGGPIVATVVPNVKKATLRAALTERVAPGSTVSTDEFMSYGLLSPDGFRHGHVNHKAKEWSRTESDGVRHSTNHVEAFWQLFKNSIRSTHIHVSQKYMQRYLDEFTFRANHRERQNAMFDLLVGAL